MKVTKGSVEVKLAAVFILFAAALLLSANVSSRLSLGGVSVAHAEDMDGDVDVVVNNTIVNEEPVTGDMAL